MMHLPTLRARQRVEREIEHLAAAAGPHPREAAIQFLHDKIDAGDAGLDPYENDHAIFVVQAAPFERLWALRAVALTGQLLNVAVRDNGFRIRCIVEADVRQELGLDSGDPPLKADEPLASRSVFALEPPLIPFTPIRLVEADPTPAAMREPMVRAQHAAALRVDCGCGAPEGLECRCTDEQRLATTPERQVH